jgi:3,4-dihydroxy 2-butanone 4-phosphate synthase / GTP cyclohydrolase II
MSNPTADSDSVSSAVTALANGRPVVLLTATGEGNLVCAADSATTQMLSFIVRHTSGFVCVALPEPECDRLSLPPMRAWAGRRPYTDYRVTVDASRGIGTGISARDRAHTISLLAAPTSEPATFTRPGHVVPVAARVGGVLENQGDAEAGVDLAVLAGLAPAAVLAAIVSPQQPQRMAGQDELIQFGTDHDLPTVSTSDLAAHLRATHSPITRRAVGSLRTCAGSAQTIGYRGDDGSEHLVLVAGLVSGGHAVPAYVHHECLLGDVFGTLRCTCAQRLHRARQAIVGRNMGVLIYVRQPVTAVGCPLSYQVGCSMPSIPAVHDQGVPGQILRDLGVLSTAAPPGLLDRCAGPMPAAEPS